MAACALLMAVWWLTEAIPLAVTALLPLLLFPFFGLMTARDAALPYADPNVFLFMGGFMIAIAMQRHNLHKRIALTIIHLIGISPKKIVLGFMIATAFLSMWISNTATAMMMLPIGIAVVEHIKDQTSEDNRIAGKSAVSNLGTALMLGIAYASSIGGVGTLIGTPPNIVFAGMVHKLFPDIPAVNFIDWMVIGFPIVVVFLPLTWLYLVYIAAPVAAARAPGNRDIIREELNELGVMSRGELLTLIVFCLTALGWIFRKDILVGNFRIPGWSNILGIESFVHDGTVALLGAMLLFVIPTNFRKGEFLLNWEWAKKIPWGILLLFGGGFALAAGFQESGLDYWIGNLFGRIHYGSVLILIISVCLLLTFLTEITSNTATITMMLPVLAAMSLAMHIHPFLVMIPATLSTSFAFMMPVATPPNAIVFGSNYIKMGDMARAGIVLNFIGMLLVTAAMYLIVIPLLRLTVH
jgi:sodium-dependent dicarboxylate transporter 2/3/5